MVPVIWAFLSADVNAGTARAARIAIIAITTSNSISVNADIIFFIFICWFLAAVVLRVFCLAAEMATGVLSQRVLLLFWGFWFRLLLDLASDFWSEDGGAYRRLRRESQQLFLLFLGVTRIAQFSQDTVE